MTSSNGRGPKKAILYARVSTQEQAEKGYSLAQQMEALREYAAREGYEIVEEVTDPGQSGASLERPGMDRMRDLVTAGGISVVLAQDRDRFSREPAYTYLLKREFEEYGCKMRTLNDRGDDSPEGELMDGIFDQFAKFERAKTAERSRRGKLRKAREGKIVAPRKVTYGFKLNHTRDGYEIDEEKMEVVRYIFRKVAEGAGLLAVKRALEAKGIPTPSGGTRWSRSTLREIIKKDAYFPHTFQEVASLVSPMVSAGLDPSKRYGIWWSTRWDIKVVERVRAADGNYTDRTTHGLKPKEEWIAVPVPNASIPREVAEQARRTLEYSFRRANIRKGRRVWELAGGLLYCGECGRRMATHSVAPSGRKPYYYYVCPRKVEENWQTCSNKCHRAESLEERVREAVAGLLSDPERIERQIEERIKREREAARDPEGEAAMGVRKLEEVANKRARFQDQQAAGLLTLSELGDKLRRLEEERQAAQRGLEMARNQQARIDELERDRTIVLSLYAGLAIGDLTVFPPEERRRVYASLGLRAVVCEDGRVEVTGNYEGDFFPAETETRELVEGVVYDPERMRAREELRARIAEKFEGGVMPCGGSS